MIVFVGTRETPAGDSQDWSEKQNCTLAPGHPAVIGKPYKNCFVLPNLTPPAQQLHLDDCIGTRPLEQQSWKTDQMHCWQSVKHENKMRSSHLSSF